MLLARAPGRLRIGLVSMLALAAHCRMLCADTPSKMVHAIVQLTGTDIPRDPLPLNPKLSGVPPINIAESMRNRTQRKASTAG